MKNEKLTKGTLNLFLLSFITLFAQQKWKSPEDSIECLKNFSLYQEYFKNKMYKEAYPFWQEVLKYCPSFSKGIYINGATMLTKLIEEEKDSLRKQKLIDTLFYLLYERIKYFGEAGYVYGLIGLYQITYTPQDIRNAYLNLVKSLDLEGRKSQSSVLSGLVFAISSLMDKNMIDEETALQHLIRISEIAYYAKDSLNNPDAYKNVLNQATSLIASKITCNKIERYITETINARHSPSNLMINTYLYILNTSKCTTSDIYFKLADLAYQNNKNYEAAVSLAKFSMDRQNYSSAIRYLEEALSLTNSDTSKQEETYLLMASIYQKLNNYPKVKEIAEKILKINKKNYNAYILIAEAYAKARDCGSNECDKKANYWVAVDILNIARSQFPEKASEISSLINHYSYNFPTKEDCFFYGIKEGDEISVGCWINTKTKARFSK